MSIQTPDDWWKLAEETLPQMPAYFEQFQLVFPMREAEEALINRDWRSLYQHFHNGWAALPDAPGIQIGIFSDLCDLCSEIWVFTEEDE